MNAMELNVSKIGVDEAEAIARHYYGLNGKARALAGERDLNFRITVNSEESCILKIHNPEADHANLEAQNAMLIHLADQASGLPIPKLIAATTGENMASLIDTEGQPRQVRLLSWLDGITWSTGTLDLYALGRFMGQLDRSLKSFDHPAAHREFPWEMKGASCHLKHLDMVRPDDICRIVTDILTKFDDTVSAKLNTCRMQVIHNDANDNNVLIADNGTVSGLIDFGDSVYSPLVCELGVAGAYAMLRQDDPISALMPLITGYHENNPLKDLEMEILYDLMRVRLAMSVCMAAVQSATDPDNEYLLISQQDINDLLRRLENENSHLVHFRFRDACGLAPSPTAPAVCRWLEENADQFAQICPVDLRTAPKWIIDMDPARDLVKQLGETDDVATLTAALNRQTEVLGAQVCIGRYREIRSIYTSDNFKTADPDERRTVHIGIDIFMPTGTPLFAPMDGCVAAFHDNAVDMDYGPIIILEHRTDSGIVFWTKYGHLSRDSLSGLSIGMKVKKAQEFARIGPFPENGNWPPHVHFQILTHLLDMGTDMHGVAPLSTLDIWEGIAPDANLILGIPENCRGETPRSNDYLIAKRQRHLSRNLSLSYDNPLKIVKGRGQYLYDDQGGEWLDMVNNVCHVGHCHPRVVEAGQKQMAQINTNTRYLHDNIVNYSRRLLATFPDPLSVCFFVNSGSEANDLALRLTHNYTGARDMLIVDHAYHGNLSSLIDISPYKFNGRGGEGCPDQTHICEMPDGYRGPYKYDDPEITAKYAASVTRHLDNLKSEGRRPAGFIAESVLGCGGQVFLPDGYLELVYEQVRATGGLCIADEVQVGFGRMGSHMWGFEMQGVVPDIVTLGKPIGNGHPVAAVITSPAVANAFATGMEYFNTFGGNPVSCAIGNAVLDVIRDERLRLNSHIVGKQILAGVRTLQDKFPLIGDVRGKGLFVGIELVRDPKTLEPADTETFQIVEEMKKHGILLSIDGPLHNVIKIKPPICFSTNDCNHFLKALEISFTTFG